MSANATGSEASSAGESASTTADGRLRADLVLEYPFNRTTGEIIGAFLTGLREGVIYGVRTSDGSIMAPPTDYDPNTAEPLTELVEVGPAGEVKSWTWCAEPRRQQPWNHPFAWALIRLDGAHTHMLHAVRVASPAEMRIGMRVEPKWNAERQGHICDIAYFEPVAG